MGLDLIVDEIDLTDLEELLESYEVGDKSRLIPLMQDAQKIYGYLPDPVMKRISEHTKVPTSRIYEVATFYTLFRFIPIGKNHIMACRGTACHVRGGPMILTELERVLGIKEGETTPDMLFSLETVACIGACGLAPSVMINKETFGRMTVQKVSSIIAEIRAKEAEEQDEE